MLERFAGQELRRFLDGCRTLSEVGLVRMPGGMRSEDGIWQGSQGLSSGSGSVS